MPRSSALKFFSPGGGGVVLFKYSTEVIKKSGYLNLIDAYNSSKPLFNGQSNWQILQKLLTQSFPGVFFPLLNLPSIPFLSAYLKANLVIAHNLVSESLQ
jgi:hypothetical protein